MRYQAGEIVALRSEYLIRKANGKKMKVREIIIKEVVVLGEYYTSKVDIGTISFNDSMIDHSKTEDLRIKRALNKLRYRAGERVFLADNLVVDETYGYQSFHRDMRSLQGKDILLLSEHPGERGTNPFYRVSVDGEYWSINDIMIDSDKTLSLKQRSVTTLSNTITVEMIGNIIETHTITAKYYVFDDCSWLHLYNSDDKIVCSFRVEDVKSVYINQ